MNRYIIVNHQTGVIDGLYFERHYAEKSAAILRETWPGLTWEVEETSKPYPCPGNVCMGHKRAMGILKRHSGADTQEAA